MVLRCTVHLVDSVLRTGFDRRSQWSRLHDVMSANRIKACWSLLVQLTDSTDEERNHEPRARPTHFVGVYSTGDTEKNDEDGGSCQRRMVIVVLEALNGLPRNERCRVHGEYVRDGRLAKERLLYLSLER